jgi:alpha-glucoside transport system substrate-binding protein
MLRTAGPEVYDNWVAHEIRWTDPAIEHAWELFGQISRNENYVFGGTTGVLSTSFSDSPAPLFDDPPGCYMHHQGDFITDFFPKDAVIGENYDFFPLPLIEPKWGTPMVGAAQVIVMGKDTPEGRQLIQYLISPEPQENWATRGGFISLNKRVDFSAYPDELTRKLAATVNGAEILRFDASNLMPPDVGFDAFRIGALRYVGGEDLRTILQSIEVSAVEAYGK